MKLSYLDLMTTDPSYNLAMEQYVFDCLPRDRMYFMLWQNDNAIIVGSIRTRSLRSTKRPCASAAFAWCADFPAAARSITTWAT